ncbi:putative bifunctional diguanylate cyclase/phosphodiesterase [Duganella violaceipulchra]|uniref:Diguanylate cyclase (GGDEF)-like protein/PAS domain S-box-containing protein n=1 Tax=Duganella violaceipulchra TaxID=2849652 RepID=A0AA41HC93_9BURK|nr:EAL domain-containing protein [Duganella violaceicalia]MBV6324644.1 EAL domain-containing protein [Duganella violaceicalia]MCP2009910.1 diguanylate cyclase (GGDEF)-like protein/PAS domain S-box-containing protein [Duganella violaceicalia]
MVAHPVSDFLSNSAALCDAVLRLRGAALAEELGRIVRSVMNSPLGEFLPADTDAMLLKAPVIEVLAANDDAVPSLTQDILFDDEYFGRFVVSGRARYSSLDREHLASLANLAGSVLQVHALAQRSSHAYVQVESQLQHQAQILDHIHESVLTMDMSGFIISWNKGAERLFGYSSVEAVGRNILFLYDDEDESFDDTFLEQGGRLMEVRRKKKSGEVFWASLSLSPLRDINDRAIGLIAYLTDITERKMAEERIHHLAYYDALTNLPNRSLLTKLVDQALTVAQRSKLHGCVLFIDLNRFKLINDTLGRKIGDELLCEVARRFRAVLRDQDLVARLGGDEFAVGLFDIGQHFEASMVAQKLLATLNTPILIDGHDLRVGGSIGISVYPQDGGDAETLLRLADIAMYRAKQEGGAEGDHVAFYSQDMNQGMQERMRIETGLRHALGHGELLLHYQPKFCIDNGKIIGAEALVRWRHPVRGLVPPIEFIPLAEATGLVVQVGEWVLEAACAQAKVWKDAGLPPIRLAVNVSAREFTAALPGRVQETLTRYGLEPTWLELEITESTLMHNIDRVIGIMDRITALGVTLSLDDFGTGYSSLSYLKRFPIDTLKIDRSFTIGIPGDANDCAIANTIISIAQQLKHKVIAEGVETVEQLAFLKNSGCDEVQGYLFSRPLEAEAFEQALRENWAPGQASRAA